MKSTNRRFLHSPQDEGKAAQARFFLSVRVHVQVLSVCMCVCVRVGSS